MTTLAPTREQAMAALEKANRIRAVRAQVKRDLKAGDIQAWPLIADPGDELLNMRVYDVLLAIPRFGVVKAQRLLARHRISQRKTLGGITERQRAELVAALKGQR